MMKIKTLTFLVISLILLGACNDDESGSTTLRLQLTDAPFPSDLVSEVNVTFNKIEIRKMDDVSGNPFMTLTEESMQFNLLDLSNGVTATLVELSVPVGVYDLVSVFVSEANIKMTDGTDFNLTIPSGAQTGIKIFIDPPIEVVGGLSAELLLDFDVSRSFIPLGNENTPPGIIGFNFNPVIRTSNQSVAGRINGSIVDVDGNGIDGVVVSLSQNNTVITTTLSDTNGNYAAIGLLAGTYDLLFEKEGFVSETIEGVEVVVANETTQNVELVTE